MLFSLVYFLVGRVTPSFAGIGTLVVLQLVNGYGEETGWRGFAVPHLRLRHGPPAASLILAIPWAIWHIPTFWLDTGMRGFPPFVIPAFLVGLAAGSIVLTWMAEGSGSILIVALWHAALNLGAATDAAAGSVAAITTTMVIFWAVRVVHLWREAPHGGASHGGDGIRTVDAGRHRLVHDRVHASSLLRQRA